MTRVFGRRSGLQLRRTAVMLVVGAAVFAVATAVAWWWPFGWSWTGAEQAGVVAGIVSAVLTSVSTVAAVLALRVAGRSVRPRVVAAGLVQVGRVPQPASWFQHRGIGVNLARAAKAGKTAVLTQVLAGMGGVGKTQLAAQFARRLVDSGELDILVWISASSRDAIVTGYAETARDLKLADGDIDPEAAAGRLLGWLERTDRRWLIVLDNLDAPGDAAGWWPPASHRGRTVVTTRRRDAVLGSDSRVVVEVDLFTPAEAAGYLTRAVGISSATPEVAGLAADLGYLPLALAQAAAFIRDRGIDVATYRQRLADRRHRLADLVPPEDALPDEHRGTVAATWSLSIEAADASPPRGLARRVLTVLALLDGGGMPTALLSTDAVIDYANADVGHERDELVVTVQMVGDVLHTLHRFSLITHPPHANLVRVHAMVQRATRDNLDAPQLATGARAAADALIEIWPDIERDATASQVLRANAAALRINAGDALLTPDVHPVLFRAAHSLGESGLVRAARGAFEALLADCLRVLGSDHPDTLGIRGNLARCRGEAGDPGGAARALEELLSDCLRVLGTDHPGSLVVRANLALWRVQAGDFVDAAGAFAELFTDCLRLLGPDHPDTLAARHNLAHWRGVAGDPVGAIAAFEQLLTDCLRVLGPDHPDTLAVRHKLALWRGAAGDPAGAAGAFQELSTDCLRALGPDHLPTLATRQSAANWRGKAGDPAGAAGAFEELLSDCLRVLGPDHPGTRATHHNLAHWRGVAGDPAGAAAAEEALLTDCLRLLGLDHPDTLVTRHNLAHWRGVAGDPAGAAAAFEELFTDCLRVLGPDHVDTLTTRHKLARWRAKAEKSSRTAADVTPG